MKHRKTNIYTVFISNLRQGPALAPRLTSGKVPSIRRAPYAPRLQAQGAPKALLVKCFLENAPNTRMDQLMC